MKDNKEKIKEIFNKYKHFYLLNDHNQSTPLMDFNNFVLAVQDLLSPTHAKDTDIKGLKNSIYKHMTVGGLKEFIKDNNIPDDSLIFFQRIYDVYFNENEWTTVKKEGFLYWYEKRLIDKAKPGGEFHDKEKYPNMTEDHIHSLLESEKIINDLKEEYILIWSPVKYKDDNNLYLDAHY